MASLSLFVALAIIAFQAAEAEVPAIFIFGDSTVDVGTNDFIPESKARADFPYNGIDYPYSQPTGRFSNGYNTADLIVRLMGYRRSPPPFLSLITHKPSFKREVLRGANFASGGSGIHDETGRLLYKKVIPLGDQIQQFSTVHGNISQVMGPQTITLISKSIFIVSVGSNDIFEYLDLNQSQHDALEFMTALMNKYQYHLKNLLDLGARKLGIVSVPPIGCCPFQRLYDYSQTNGGCSDEMNTYAQMFHRTVKDLLANLTLDYIGLKYSLGNAYDMTMDILDNPLVFGFKDIKTACCGNGTLNAGSACEPDAKLCLNRDEYLFWDRFHPTQAAAKLAALTLHSGSLRFVSPMNFSQLAENRD